MVQLEIEFPRGPRPDRHPRLFDDDENQKIDPATLDLLENGRWHRASGSMVCGWCHYQYREHPTYSKYGLTVLCDQTMVHL